MGLFVAKKGYFCLLISSLLYMKSYILIENLVLYAYHGVMPQENIVGNEYIINVKIRIDLTESCQSDDLDDTISYADVCDLIELEMNVKSKLIEHAAKRIVDRLMGEYPQIEGIELRLSKRNPPMGRQIDCASVLLIEGEV